MNQTQPLLMEFDCGNSSAKWRLLSNAGPVAGGMHDYRSGFSAFLNALPVSVDQITGCRVASVAPPVVDADLKKAWSDYSSSPIRFACVEKESAGIVCGYEDVSQMGVDRWSALIGASSYLSGSCVVIDAGTAITADILNSKRRHIGGYILPGFGLMLDVLREKTAISDQRIPSSEVLGDMSPGNETASAIANAITLAVSAFVSHVVSVAEKDARLILTGGQSELLGNIVETKADIFPDLVLDGLAFLLPMEFQF